MHQTILIIVRIFLIIQPMNIGKGRFSLKRRREKGICRLNGNRNKEYPRHKEYGRFGTFLAVTRRHGIAYLFFIRLVLDTPIIPQHKWGEGDAFQVKATRSCFLRACR